MDVVEAKSRLKSGLLSVSGVERVVVAGDCVRGIEDVKVWRKGSKDPEGVKVVYAKSGGVDVEATLKGFSAKKEK